MTIADRLRGFAGEVPRSFWRAVHHADAIVFVGVTALAVVLAFTLT